MQRRYLAGILSTTTRVGVCSSAAPCSLRAVLPRSLQSTVEADVLLPILRPQQVELSPSQNGTGWAATTAPSSLHAISPCGLQGTPDTGVTTLLFDPLDSHQ